MKTFIVIFTFIACAFSLPSYGQTAYQHGDLMVNTGLGLGSSVYGGVSLNANVEYFINDEVSLGGGFGYSGYSRSYYFGDRLRINVFYFGPRGSYHFAKALDITNEQLDLYAGVFVGFAVVTASYGGETITGYSGTPGAFGYDFFGGARYQFNPKIGAFGELGFGISIFQFGATFKL
ncbi:MAG: hypothetical protein RIG62_24475 [Cyclobacteriaceae bacterium]|jgi:hypothetical protein